MSKVRVIYTPARPSRSPKPPPWWRSFWYRTETIVEYRGLFWKRILNGAGDQVWLQWVRVDAAYIAGRKVER